MLLGEKGIKIPLKKDEKGVDIHLITLYTKSRSLRDEAFERSKQKNLEKKC
jgi:hypothetical protein